MGSLPSSTSFKNYTEEIETTDGNTFEMSSHSLIEHILLLRKVIDHPEMTREGPILNSFVKDYCQRMAHGKMKTADQQLKLPWQIEWIWHVHRLHPHNYLNDCKEQLPDGLVEKRTHKFLLKHKKKSKSNNNNNPLFYPSIDLSNAIIRQNDFLNKFKKHFLYHFNLKLLSKSQFQSLIQDYVSFIKLARKGQLLVPTFDIDLIWHTHMRYPSEYHEFSIASCGFILDHDDSIEPSILAEAYKKTANQWRKKYNSEYEKNTNLITPISNPTTDDNQRFQSDFISTYIYSSDVCDCE